MAQIYTTVRGERSRYFGPEETWTFTGNGRTYTNLQGDFFFKRAVRERTIENLLLKKPPNGPLPAIRRAVKGYVRGYNRYLNEMGVDNLPDETCRGAAWVKPITLLDAYRRFFMLGIQASQGVSIDGIVGAQPPGRRSAAATGGLPHGPRPQMALPPSPPTGQTSAPTPSPSAAPPRRPRRGCCSATRTSPGRLGGSSSPRSRFPESSTSAARACQSPGDEHRPHAQTCLEPDGLHPRSASSLPRDPVPGDPTSYYVDGQPRR